MREGEDETELKQGILLALEAAEAANDASGEIAAMKGDVEAAAARIDRFARMVKPLMLGALGGSVVVIGLGSLVYFRTLSEMRTATATQLEALTLFSTTVTELTEQLALVEGITDHLQGFAESQAAGFDGVMTRLESTDLVLGTRIAEEAEATRTGLTESLTAQGEALRADLIAGVSDLQLALTRMLADGVAPTAAAPGSAAPATGGQRPTAAPRATPPAAAAPAPRPAAAPAPRRTRAAAPPPNPFSYP